uniref:Uncharacterized protein n=1 Tax=Rhizophora mucronata TaxID=61149 RepID=A0A2P2NXZ8_RHIMU
MANSRMCSFLYYYSHLFVFQLNL